MARMGNFDMRGLEQFRDNLKKLQDPDVFVQECAKELAARLLRKVIKRTPKGDYSETYDLEDDGQEKFLVMSDKKGGTLKRGWTTQRDGSGSEGLKTRGATEFIDTLKVQHFGNSYVIEIINSVEYASYVEYGHRQQPGRYVPAIAKRLKKGWAEGQFMMTISEEEIRKSAPGILEKKIYNYLRSAFKNG